CAVHFQTEPVREPAGAGDKNPTSQLRRQTLALWEGASGLPHPTGFQSGRPDLNRRSSGPKPDAIPDFATPRGEPSLARLPGPLVLETVNPCLQPSAQQRVRDCDG